jgi:hypothetical protein
MYHRMRNDLLVTLTGAGTLHRAVAALAIALMAVVAASCHATPTGPSAAGVAGNWAGSTCPPNYADACSIWLTISQEGRSLSGTYGTTSSSGALTGAITGSVVSLSMTPSYPPNASTSSIAATVKGNQMTGTINGRPVSLSRSSQ